MRFTPEGKAVVDLNLAVDDGYGDNKKTIWIKATAWEKTAENCNNFLHKGSLVFIEGRLHHENGNPRVWESNGKTGASYEVVVMNIRFLSPKEQTEPDDEF
jgi:single-strand DNA-binding protein